MTEQPTAPRAVPTSADVARRAGVSRATVSYALNDTAGGRVSEQTRERVRAAAADLGYVPHAAARSLRAGHTGIVLLTIPEIVFGPLFARFLHEMRTGLRAHGYTTVIHGTSGGEAPASAWAELRPTAVVSSPSSGLTPEGVDLLRRSGTRTVLTIGDAPVAGAHTLTLDQAGIGACAAGHLMAAGHRRIGAIVPTDRTLDRFSLPRLDGVRAAFAGHGGSRVERLDLDYTEESAARLAGHWRESGLTGLFTYNDEFALLLLSAFQDAGIRVPGDAALVGADDLMLARLTRPRLTTVRQELTDGGTLAGLIDRLIRHPDTPVERPALGSARIVARDSA